MKISYKLNMDHMIAASMFAYEKLGGRQLRRVKMAYVMCLVLLSMLFYSLAEKVTALTILVVGALFFPVMGQLILISVKRFYKKFYSRPEYSYVFAETHLELSKEALKTKGALGQAEYKWEAVVKLHELPGLWMISLQGNQMICVPKMALETQDQAVEFKSFFESIGLN